MDSIEQRRAVLKSMFGRTPSPMSQAPQAQGAPAPEYVRPARQRPVVDLPGPDEADLVKTEVRTCIAQRQSRRQFSEAPLTLAELAWLLWATQGLRRNDGGVPRWRTVPSAGARHPFETYVAAWRIDGLSQDTIYRYMPATHQLETLATVEDLAARVVEASCNQQWIGRAAGAVLWACVPARSEYRYGLDAVKLCLLDAGHIAQNLYLAAEAIDAGVCGVGAYDQDAIDHLLDLDGRDEMIVYYSPVGKNGRL
ncbi:MAG: SagB/ThcOx family dehydrogenase [Planctomycetes bacterium]|nr:SagB/ThcOx family dehydrogenase [Planctomycetota bacterium]